jgi:SAM-dependent methyltransferase
MRRLVVLAGGAAVAGAVALLPRSRGTTWSAWVRDLAWSWAGVPSGPLGWVSSHWVMPRLHGPIYPLVARELGLRPEDDLLEVACGSGIFLAEQASHVRHVAGIDLSEVQLDLARQRLADRVAAGTAEIVRGDAASLPWADGHLSVVTCMGSREAFPDPARALGEMHRVLRPGGRAVVTMGARVAEGTETHQVLGAVWVWNEPDVRRLVEAAGFADVSIAYAPTSGDSRLAAVVNRLVTMEDMRLVRGVKAPEEVPASASEDATPSLAGARAG